MIALSRGRVLPALAGDLQNSSVGGLQIWRGPFERDDSAALDAIEQAPLFHPRDPAAQKRPSVASTPIRKGPPASLPSCSKPTSRPVTRWLEMALPVHARAIEPGGSRAARTIVLTEGRTKTRA